METMQIHYAQLGERGAESSARHVANYKNNTLQLQRYDWKWRDSFRVDLSAGFASFPVSSHALFIDEGLAIGRQENWKIYVTDRYLDFIRA